MILDRQLLFSGNQAVTASAVSTNAVDLGSARNIGIGGQLELVIRVTATFAGGTSLQFSFITSPNADLSGAATLVQTPAIPVASLTAGTEWLRINVPVASLPAQAARYIGVQYTAVGTFTSGTVTAGLVLDREAQAHGASGLNTTGF